MIKIKRHAISSAIVNCYYGNWSHAVNELNDANVSVNELINFFKEHEEEIVIYDDQDNEYKFATFSNPYDAAILWDSVMKLRNQLKLDL